MFHLHDTQTAFAVDGNRAYIKSVRLTSGDMAQAIFTTEGVLLAVVADRELAFATLRQYDIEPVSVH